MFPKDEEANSRTDAVFNWLTVRAELFLQIADNNNKTQDSSGKYEDQKEMSQCFISLI